MGGVWGLQIERSPLLIFPYFPGLPDVKLGQELGRIAFKDVVPRTADNFRAHCTDEKGNGNCEKPHHPIKNFMFQGITPTQKEKGTLKTMKMKIIKFILSRALYTLN